MTRFQKIAPWISRLIVLFPAALFIAIGVRYAADVTGAAGARGIVFVSGLGTTIGRVGFGAFPLACGLFLLGCLFSERRLLTALALVATMDSTVLVVRIAGMIADSSIHENLGLVRMEVLLLAITAVGILIELARRRRKLPSFSAPDQRSSTLGRPPQPNGAVTWRR